MKTKNERKRRNGKIKEKKNGTFLFKEKKTFKKE